MSLRRLSGLGSTMPKTVCIVGAGPSGLVAAKTLLHNAPPGHFHVSVVDAQHDIGGLWPTSVEDTGRQIHPLMVANQSRHTVHFSDLAWDEGAPQLPLGWQIGSYLKRYAERYLDWQDNFELSLETRVVGATPRNGDGEGGGGWDVLLRSARGDEQRRTFDYLLVASGFFGKPIVPEGLRVPADVPVIHSSAYRDLQQLLPKGTQGKLSGGKILVVGGQMSGVEIAGTIGTHLSAAVNSPQPPTIEGIEAYTVHHVIQRPVWVFPLFTSPEPTAAAAPFLPLDFASYNLSNRPQPLANTQGHITTEAAKMVHGMFQAVVGTDQSEFSPHLQVTDEAKTKPPYLAVSDWYIELVRSGLITVSHGKVESLQGTSAVLSDGGGRIDDVAAVVVATGFDASPCLDFLPQSVLEKLNHSPRHLEQPLALAFHGTHHPGVPGLGFVGFYRSPYWGVMQMQARVLSRLWSGSGSTDESATSAVFAQKLAQDASIQRTLDLRDDARLSQFPMGDYPFIVQEMTEALGLSLEAPIVEGLPDLSHNQKPLNMLTPSRYPDAYDDDQAKEEARRLRQDTHQTALAGLTTPKFVARAVFRSLLGTWKLERDLVSKLPSHPTGHFSGTARFLLRDKTSEGLQCAEDSTSVSPSSSGFEYLYVEEGEFTTNGFSFKATRRYVWRYDDNTDTVSVWFTKPDDDKTADYLFHEVEFEQPAQGARLEADGWRAKSGHLCIDDYYDVEYKFKFRAVNLRDWSIGYTVKGPKKDYTISGTYTR